MESQPISKVRRNLSSIVQKLNTASQSEPVQINIRGKAAAVILSSEEYNHMRRQILDQEIDSIFAEFHEANVALASK